MDDTHPRLSWQIISDTRGTRQTAYQILVASSVANPMESNGNIWDSGKKTSDRKAR